MKRALEYGVAGVTLALVAFLAPLSAQHGLAAKFDLKKSLRLQGTVTQVEWTNPYAHLVIKVNNPSGPIRWAVELESPIILARNGWSETTVKPGDVITVQGFASRDGRNQISGNTVTLAGKSVLTGFNGTPPPRRTAAAAPTPRWPDGKPRLGPPAGETGYWGNPSKTALVQDGANVPMDAYGLLRNIGDVDKVAPMQKWARDLYELRQRDGLASDPMFLLCKPPGGPRQYQSIYGFQLMENKEFNRIFVLHGGGNRNQRVMYTDGREQVGQIRGDADNPLYYGRTVARWEGDTLVADTRGFNEKFWFDNGGLPHTAQLQLLEKFTRTDMNTLKYEVTINDPGAYTKPWTASWTFEWVAGEETPYYLCLNNRP